jgi:hypothetical protein
MPSTASRSALLDLVALERRRDLDFHRLGRAGGGDVRPALGPRLEQLSADQHVDRLAHRPDADGVRAGQVAVTRQLRAWRKLAADDLGAEAVAIVAARLRRLTAGFSDTSVPVFRTPRART